MFVLKVKHGKIQQERQEKLPEGFVNRDLHQPIPMKNYRDMMPDVPMTLPKGFI
jgi:hypothetical protein